MTEAKAKLSELLRRVSAGESILILSRGRPVAKLSPVGPASEGEDARLARLEESGVLRQRGGVVDPSGLADAEEAPLPPERSLLHALLEEREEGR